MTLTPEPSLREEVAHFLDKGTPGERYLFGLRERVLDALDAAEARIADALRSIDRLLLAAGAYDSKLAAAEAREAALREALEGLLTLEGGMPLSGIVLGGWASGYGLNGRIEAARAALSSPAAGEEGP